MKAAIAAVAGLLLLAPPASADPLRIWSLSRIEQGLGKVPVAGDTQVFGDLSRFADLGGVSLHPRGQDDRAQQHVFSSADGAHSFTFAEAPSLGAIRPGAAKGGDARLDSYQAYVKRADNASLRISIRRVLLDAIDSNNGAKDCFDDATCAPLRAIARFRARAYTADGAFYDVGGTVYLEGYNDHWVIGAATAWDARGVFWKRVQFDAGDNDTRTEASLGLHRDDQTESQKPVTLTVPLASIRTGELFAVHVSMESEAIDDRGGESYVSAFIEDPQEPGLIARGLTPRSASALKEPRVRPRPAARCRGSRPHAGTVQLNAPAYSVGEASGTPMVLVTRSGGSRGAASVELRARGDSMLVRFEDGDTSPRLVDIPIREDLLPEPPERFTVSLAHAACAKLGAQRSAVVTVLDDDQPLVETQPSPPVATPSPAPVEPPPPAGLDAGFGSGGRVSTPVGGGQGEAVVIQPGGEIVTAGWRTVGAGTDFALTRHDASGRLDGIATTDLGGAGDQAYDAALLPGGGIVAVGRTDAAGIAKPNFGMARWTAELKPDGAVVRTDILGGAGQANAVAVQPDGKIVVGGFAIRNGIDSDLALVRYLPNGTPDPDFGDHGIVTTDLGTRSDDARALVIRPDGKIVVAGTADENVALAIYTSGGQLEKSTITNLGAEAVATGVALTANEIEVAGYTLGAHVNRDFLLLRYRADGTLDPAFTPVKTDLSGGDDFAENLAVDSAGRTILVGRATSSTILDMALVRYRADGTLDPTFDGDGILTADFHGRGEFGQDLALDAAGRIVAAGYTANGADTQFALMRANP